MKTINNNAKKFIFIGLTVVLLIAFISVLIVFSFHAFEKGKREYLDYGDDFEGYMAYTMDNQKVEMETQGTNVYFYVSETCDTCIDVIGLCKALSDLNKSADIKFFNVWENGIPEKKISKLGINKSTVLSLHGKYRFGAVKPYFFVVKDGVVDFTTQDYKELIDRLIYYENDNDVLMKAVFSEIVGEDNTNTKAIAFVSGRDQIINKEELGIDEVYIIADYRKEDVIYDQYGLYRKVFDIKEFPTVVTSNGDFFNILQ